MGFHAVRVALSLMEFTWPSPLTVVNLRVLGLYKEIKESPCLLQYITCPILYKWRQKWNAHLKQPGHICLAGCWYNLHYFSKKLDQSEDYNKKKNERGYFNRYTSKIIFLASCSKEIPEIGLICNGNNILKPSQILKHHGCIFFKWLFILEMAAKGEIASHSRGEWKIWWTQLGKEYQFKVLMQCRTLSVVWHEVLRRYQPTAKQRCVLNEGRSRAGHSTSPVCGESWK